MHYRRYPASEPLLRVYDPHDLPSDHLARLVEQVVEAAELPTVSQESLGQPAFNPRLMAKVLIFGYATGARSSRQLERLCRENLAFLYLTRGDAPSYRTLCHFRVEEQELLEQVWVALFAVAEAAGLQRLGRIVVDSSKFKADASPEAVIKAEDYERFKAEFRRIQSEANAKDRLDEEGAPGTTQLGQTVKPEQMRSILRRVRSQKAAEQRGEAPAKSAKEPAPLGAEMLSRVELALQTIEAAEQDGLKHACLTDPDARMLPEGREKHIHECHSFEVAVDQDTGLLVAGQTVQEGDAHRLEPLVEAAFPHEPGGVVLATGDSGYYQGEAIARLEAQRIETCVPDGMTAHALRNGTLDEAPSPMALRYDAERDVFVCANGRLLVPAGRRERSGYEMQQYRAERACTDCPLKAQCLINQQAKRRETTRALDPNNPVATALARFLEPEQQERYRNRGKVVETVFAFLRRVLGYSRWMVRGKERVSAEGSLFKCAYQFRKVHSALKG
jgi:transposase